MAKQLRGFLGCDDLDLKGLDKALRIRALVSNDKSLQRGPNIVVEKVPLDETTFAVKDCLCSVSFALN